MAIEDVLDAALTTTGAEVAELFLRDEGESVISLVRPRGPLSRRSSNIRASRKGKAFRGSWSGGDAASSVRCLARPAALAHAREGFGLQLPLCASRTGTRPPSRKPRRRVANGLGSAVRALRDALSSRGTPRLDPRRRKETSSPRSRPARHRTRCRFGTATQAARARQLRCAPGGIPLRSTPSLGGAP